MSGMNVRLAFAVVSSACWSAFQHGYSTGVMNAPQNVMSQWLQLEALSGTNVTVKATEEPRVATIWSIAVSMYCVGGMIGGMLTGVIADRVRLAIFSAQWLKYLTVKATGEPRVATIWSIAVSVYCVGGMIGGMLTGVIADRFGRKGGLLLNNALVFVSAAFQGTAKVANSAELLIFGRLVIGINSGLNAGLAPMYLAEISPVSLRGSIGTVYQLVITISILLSQGLGLESVLGTEEGWPWLLAVCAVPAVIQCVTLPLCPESPKYLLLNKGRELHAQRALNWLRGDVAVHGEMEEMHQEAEKNKVSKKVTLRELFGNRQLRQPLLIAMTVMVAQQLSGINAVMFYSTDIFTQAGLEAPYSQYATLGTGAMNVLMTVVSLVLVEVAGRKTLLLVGFSGMFLSSVLLLAAMLYVSSFTWMPYVCIVLVILFVVMFAVGPGSIPWFLVNELFNQSSRPAAASVAVTVNWAANFLVGLTFLPLQLALKAYVFVIFAVFQLFFIFFISMKVPETKNKTVEEVTAMFRQQL